MENIYLVMHAYYSEWRIYGYFTNRLEADKYCVAHPDRECHVEIVPCLDNQEDFSEITLKYEHTVVFDEINNSWVMRDEPNRYEMYMADYLRSNSVKDGFFVNHWLSFKVNISKDDRKLAEKIAQDMLYQFLDFCHNEPDGTYVNQMNEILSADERARLDKERENQLRQKELAELKRLKEKYEGFNPSISEMR